MAGAVDVGVMPLGGFIFDVGGRDGDPPLALFGSIVDLVEGPVFAFTRRFQQNLGDGGGQRGLSYNFV